MKSHKENGLFFAKGLGVLLTLLIASYTLRYVQGFSFSEIEPFSQKNIAIVVSGKTKQIPLSQIISVETKSSPTHISFLEGFLYWSGIKTNHHSPIVVNEKKLESFITNFEDELNFEKVSEGNITIKNNQLVIQNPQNGTIIDREHIQKNITRLAQKRDTKRNYTLYSRTKIEKPKTDIPSFEKSAAILSFALANPLTLENKTFNISHTIPQEEVPMLFDIETDENFVFQVAINTPYLNELVSKYNREAKDATFKVVEDYYVEIVPSQVGITVDTARTSQKILTNLQQEKNISELIFSEPINPTFTTKDAEDLNIKHLVSSFTTYYSCCESRARNIQKFADLVNGAVVYPGEEFNLNTYAGKRTEDEGFEPAGTLIKGQLIETIGGGVSQFATTFFNAIYWGGYKDITHKPHSRYFSRYPEGIEATISWPEPHLIFQNDSLSGIWITATYTNNSVTVSFFGDNDERILKGFHKDGHTTIEIKNEGGTNARIVQSEVSPREELHEPKEVYFTNEFTPPGAVLLKSEGRPNYSVEVTRTIMQDGEQKSKDVKTVRYLSEDKEFFVHSCEYAPPMSICKTPEDLEREKEELKEFFAQIEGNT